MDRNVCLNLHIEAVKIEKWRTKMLSEAGPKRKENR